MTTVALILFIALEFCHWAADYTQLSNFKMLAAKKNGRPLLPILEHASVHGGLMFFPLLFVLAHNPIKLFLVVALEILSHFLIDVLKGRINVCFPTTQSPANVYHWWIFGIDQMLHQIFIILIVYFAI